MSKTRRRSAQFKSMRQSSRKEKICGFQPVNDARGITYSGSAASLVSPPGLGDCGSPASLPASLPQFLCL